MSDMTALFGDLIEDELLGNSIVILMTDYLLLISIT